MNQRKYAKVGGAPRRTEKKLQKGHRLPEAGRTARRNSAENRGVGGLAGGGMSRAAFRAGGDGRPGAGWIRTGAGEKDGAAIGGPWERKRAVQTGWKSAGLEGSGAGGSAAEPWRGDSPAGSDGGWSGTGRGHDGADSRTEGASVGMSGRDGCKRGGCERGGCERDGCERDGGERDGGAEGEGPSFWEDWAERPLEGYDEDLTPDRDRAFSRQTVYLVHKWLAEGMPLPMVARILNRSVENVQAAAEAPLRKGEKALLLRYFAPFRMRKDAD